MQCYFFRMFQLLRMWKWWCRERVRERNKKKHINSNHSKECNTLSCLFVCDACSLFLVSCDSRLTSTFFVLFILQFVFLLLLLLQVSFACWFYSVIIVTIVCILFKKIQCFVLYTSSSYIRCAQYLADSVWSTDVGQMSLKTKTHPSFSHFISS